MNQIYSFFGNLERYLPIRTNIPIFMYRDRGGSSAKSEMVGGGGGGPLDRKRINDALDKHLEKTSSSTSRVLNNNSKEKEKLSMPSTSAAGGGGKSHHMDHHRDNRSSSTLANPKNKGSDGLFSSEKSVLSERYGMLIEE